MKYEAKSRMHEQLQEYFAQIRRLTHRDEYPSIVEMGLAETSANDFGFNNGDSISPSIDFDGLDMVVYGGDDDPSNDGVTVLDNALGGDYSYADLQGRLRAYFKVDHYDIVKIRLKDFIIWMCGMDEFDENNDVFENTFYDDIELGIILASLDEEVYITTTRNFKYRFNAKWLNKFTIDGYEFELCSDDKLDDTTAGEFEPYQIAILIIERVNYDGLFDLNKDDAAKKLESILQNFAAHHYSRGQEDMRKKVETAISK